MRFAGRAERRRTCASAARNEWLAGTVPGGATAPPGTAPRSCRPAHPVGQRVEPGCGNWRYALRCGDGRKLQRTGAEVGRAVHSPSEGPVCRWKINDRSASEAYYALADGAPDLKRYRTRPPTPYSVSRGRGAGEAAVTPKAWRPPRGRVPLPARGLQALPRSHSSGRPALSGWCFRRLYAARCRHTPVDTERCGSTPRNV